MKNYEHQGTIDFADIVRSINTRYPIGGLSVYSNGCAVVERHSTTLYPDVRTAASRDHVRGDRNMITKLTNKARKRLAWTALATSVEFRSIITLTYGQYGGERGDQVKADFRRFAQWMTRYPVGDYLWVLEFQRRGKPHFHIVTELTEPTARDRANMATAWLRSQGVKSDRLGMVTVGGDRLSMDMHQAFEDNYSVTAHAKSWEPIRATNGAAHYLVKYAAKPYQKNVPENYQNVGRFWGASSGVRDKIRPSDHFDLDEGVLRDILQTYGSWLADKPLIPKLITDLKIDLQCK